MRFISSNQSFSGPIAIFAATLFNPMRPAIIVSHTFLRIRIHIFPSSLVTTIFVQLAIANSRQASASPPRIDTEGGAGAYKSIG